MIYSIHDRQQYANKVFENIIFLSGKQGSSGSEFVEYESRIRILEGEEGRTNKGKLRLSLPLITFAAIFCTQFLNIQTVFDSYFEQSFAKNNGLPVELFANKMFLKKHIFESATAKKARIRISK